MKKVIALLLVAVLLIPAVSAYTGEQLNTADALNHLGLFLGTGTSYELDAELTRAQGITLLVRMLGKEEEAASLPYTAPFTDVEEWAKPYVNYAWLHSITNGVSDVRFDSEGVMTDFMFLTLALRVLGYKDSGENATFTWDIIFRHCHLHLCIVCHRQDILYQSLAECSLTHDDTSVEVLYRT